MSALFLPSWLIGKFFKNNVPQKLASYAGGVSESFRQASSQHLTGAEQEANRFSAQQAEIARDFEETMYNQYNSPEAMVRQYQQAGLNPALMYGHSVGSGSFGASSPSSVAASSGFGLGVFSQLLDIFRTQAELRQVKAQTANINADTERIESQTTGQNIENEFKPDLLSQQLKTNVLDYENTRLGMHLLSEQIMSEQLSHYLTRAEVNQILAETNLTNKRIATESLQQQHLSVTDELLAAQIISEKVMPVYKAAEIALMKNNTDKVGLDVLHEQFDQEFRDTFGMLPDQPIWNSIIGALGYVSRNSVSGVMNIYEKVKSLVAKKRSKTD